MAQSGLIFMILIARKSEETVLTARCRTPRTHSAFKLLKRRDQYWRRGWDSNPRAPYGTRRFRGAPVTTTSVPLRVGHAYRSCWLLGWRRARRHDKRNT